MDDKEARNIEQVCKKLMETENGPWSNEDEFMALLEMLDDEQLCRESAVQLTEHRTRHIVPNWSIPNQHLLTSMILDAVSTILITYDMIGMLISQKHRYILQYYLALEQAAKLNLMKKNKG